MTRAKPEPETPAAIWVTRAQSGDRTTYFTGDLASDRHKYGVARLANEWLRLSDQKLVLLLQKRLGVNTSPISPCAPGSHSPKPSAPETSSPTERPYRKLMRSS